jgi:hypothetical protein
LVFLLLLLSAANRLVVVAIIDNGLVGIVVATLGGPFVVAFVGK